MSRTYNDAMFIDTFEHEYTWLNGFMRNVRNLAGKTAVIDLECGRSWSYKELNKQSNKLAHALIGSGIRKDSVVMILLRNSPEFCFAYIGVRKAGAILQPVNCSLGYGELALLLEHNRPEAFIYHEEFTDTVEKALQECTWNCKTCIVVQEKQNSSQSSCSRNHMSYSTFTEQQPTENPVLDFRPHIYDEVLRLCTSGTTSLAKSVPINDINEVLSAHDVIMQYPMNKNDITMNMTPWFHRGGCHSGGLCPTFYAGASLVVMRKFSPQKTLDYVQTYGITFLAGVPANLDLLCHAQQVQKRDLSCLRGIVTMGSPLSKEKCLAYAAALTPNIFNGYGTTETFWNSFLRPYDLPQKAGSAGTSCIDDEVRIVKEHASPEELVARDNATTGEIIIRCPGKTTYAYHDDDTYQSEKFRKGWVYTGDIGTWDTDGTISIVGRRDNLMIIAGENVYPEQIEEAACACPLIKDCLVTSIPDSKRGHAMVAYIVPEKNEHFSIQAIKDFYKASPTLSKYKVPRYYAVVESLPLTATGKKSHALIKAKALEDLKNGLLRRI